MLTNLDKRCIIIRNMNPEYPLFTRQDLVDDLPVLQENEAFFHQKTWEAIQAGDHEAASNYIDIHAEAELKADEVEAHIMDIDFNKARIRALFEREYSSPEIMLGAFALAAAGVNILPAEIKPVKNTDLIYKSVHSSEELLLSNENIIKPVPDSKLVNKSLASKGDSLSTKYLKNFHKL
jgi:hypothetical protein